MDFLLGLWEDLKGLAGPFFVLIKGLGVIIAKIFAYLAELIRNLSSNAPQ